MILKRLLIHRLPGIDQPFEIEAEGAGIHVIFGPNEVGKSSICRAVEGLYWDDRGTSRRTLVNGEFEWDGAIWWAEREGTIVRWRGDGEGKVSPKFPHSRYYHCFFLRLRDLLRLRDRKDPSRDSTSDIASESARRCPAASTWIGLPRSCSSRSHPTGCTRKRTISTKRGMMSRRR